jgi:hypothetical protein
LKALHNGDKPLALFRVFPDGPVLKEDGMVGQACHGGNDA